MSSARWNITRIYNWKFPPPLSSSSIHLKLGLIILTFNNSDRRKKGVHVSMRRAFHLWKVDLFILIQAACVRARLWQQSAQNLMHRKHYGGRLSRWGRRTRKSASRSWWSASLEVSCKTGASDQAAHPIPKHCRIVSLLSFHHMNFWSRPIGFVSIRLRGNEPNCNGVSIIDAGAFVHYLSPTLFYYWSNVRAPIIASRLPDRKIKPLVLWADLPARI